MYEANSLDIKNLRALISAVENPLEKERYPFTEVAEGFLRGALTEITGHGKTEFLFKFLAENQTLRVAWIEEELTLYPLAVAERHVKLDRVLFIEAGEEVSWAIFQVLRSGLFECVVITPQRKFDDKTLRRFQLEAERSHAGVFLLTEKQHHAWPISLQIEMNKNSEKGVK